MLRFAVTHEIFPRHPIAALGVVSLRNRWHVPRLVPGFAPIQEYRALADFKLPFSQLCSRLDVRHSRLSQAHLTNLSYDLWGVLSQGVPQVVSSVLTELGIGRHEDDDSFSQSRTHRRRDVVLNGERSQRLRRSGHRRILHSSTFARLEL